MEQSIQQLFLRYLQNRATKTEIDSVIELINTGGYEAEWEAAMLELETNFVANVSEGKLDQQKLFQRIQEKKRWPKLYSLRWVGYAASIVVVFLVGYLLSRPAAELKPALEHITANVPAKKTSGRKWIKLPDGSSVQLNSNSRLDYPETFAGKERVVKLTGEAYFDIKHDAKHPFVIYTGKIKTTVLGTAFNISSDAASEKVTVTVTRGRVMVQEANHTLAVLTANEELSWQRGKTEAKRNVNAAEVVAWKNQDLIMDDITLDQAAELIAKRYQVKVSFKSDAVKTCRFTAAFLNRNDIQQVIDVLKEITGATIVLQDKHLIISGSGCVNTNQ